ncbi:MAG: UDP-N-acetylmuramoyl-tripeptide--D-alanyl-D-alanine ligase [Odoribacter sp.]|nr:UDP-N-acetylmuramoyl-tripeptide--D-alanyl-D-alanine ligase [Odoribacter sp.]
MNTDKLYSLFKESAGVSTDTRTIKKGEMFFALWGSNFNGNLYAAEALKKGASIAVIDDHFYETEKTILVDDCLFELQALASHHRKELKIPVLAITGTNGKTTTKELIAAIMSKKMKVHYTRGNLNNHIGVPVTILSAPQETEMMIIEMGANHIGEIRTLCLIAKPDYGIITNIGAAHIEGFGSIEGVVKAKTELYEYLRKTNGVALYNDKNKVLTEKIFKIVNRAVPYSDPTGTSLLVEQIPSELYLKLTVEYQHKTYTINTKLFGRYNIENVKAAIATCLFLGVDMADIAKTVEKYVPGNNRSQIKVTSHNTIICDSYNANPKSMSKALESFAELKADKKLIILGDMLELGEKTPEEHLNILKNLKTQGVKDVFLVGPVFSSSAKEFGYKSFPDVDTLKEFILSKPIKGSHIFVKGSRGIGLERIYDLL